MPLPALLPALRGALHRHEIGKGSPYRLSFAGKGTSGASFGRLQGDLANGPAIVRQTFRAALDAAGIAEGKVEALVTTLTRPAATNPLDAIDAALADAALDSAEGRRLVDSMDEALMAGLCRALDRCLAAAAAGGRQVTPEAQVMMALWINMSGAPTTLLRWLGGQAVALARPVAAPGTVVDAAAMEGYLGACAYFAANPRNLAHLCRAAKAQKEEGKVRVREIRQGD